MAKSKARRVTLTLEVETDLGLKDLRKCEHYDLTIRDSRLAPDSYVDVRILQAQANVLKATS